MLVLVWVFVGGLLLGKVCDNGRVRFIRLVSMR